MNKNILIVGAGVAGRLLKKDIESGVEKYGLKVIGFVDDILGSDVLGRMEDIPRIIVEQKIEEIVIALPSERGKVIRKVLLFKSEHPNVSIKILPRATDIVIGGDVSYDMVRLLELTDVVGDKLNRKMHEEVANQLTGKVIVVTGGGGSIGSELSKQILLSGPKKIVVIDSCELNLFNISNSLNKLKQHVPNTEIDFVLGSVLNVPLITRLFTDNKVDYVFHAAAYKHVPIVESNTYEGVANNFLATYQTALLAQKYGVRKFVLISTDKAVKPLNVMGKTKRLAELATRYIDNMATGEYTFTSVRFGNVFNSSGSAVQLFLDQIEVDGTLTITDARMTRFFMTIPEAVHLVLQAAVSSEKGKTYMLEMGDPVKIEELAKCIAVLKGRRLSEIRINYCGLRPGEKLEEELFDSAAEERHPTQNKRIFAISNKVRDDHDSVNFNTLKEDFLTALAKEYVQSHSTKGNEELLSLLSKVF